MYAVCNPPRKTSVLLPNRLVAINNNFYETSVNGYRPKEKTTSAVELLSLNTIDNFLKHLTFTTGWVQK